MKKLKNYSIISFIIGCSCISFSQNYISGTVYNKGNAYCSTNLNNAGTFVNAAGGNFYITGNSTNSGTTAYDGGTLLFAGSSAQSSGGSAVFYTTNVTFNNASGIAVNKCLSVNNTALFTSGLVTTPVGSTEPVEFTSPALPSGTSNTSHVNGYVRKLGTGAFTYPVGDAAMYQQVMVNPTVNTTGMVVKYFPADAGVAPFGTTGTDPVALQYYNHLEYWNIAPVSTATGVVTVFWDAYNNQGIGSPTDLRVAHLPGAQWLNEGTTGVGTVAAGSVTSNALTAWSPFTIGSISSNSPLPITLTGFGASVSNCSVSLMWRVATETNFSYYELQYSSDAIHFSLLTKEMAKGNNSIYSYQHNPETEEMLYYRLKMVDLDGSVTYSDIISADIVCLENSIKVYPTVTSGSLTINTGHHQSLSGNLYDSMGRLVRTCTLNEAVSKIDISNESEGIYYLVIKTTDEKPKTFKILKTN